MKLNNSLVILDLETTGLWIEKDKIVEIGMIKCQLDGSQENYVKRINPGIAIPKTVSNIIGISALLLFKWMNLTVLEAYT